MKILSKQNFNQNESKNFVVDNLSSAPSNPILGQVYYNTQNERAYVCIKSGETPEWADLSLQEEVSIGGEEPNSRDIKIWINPEDMVSSSDYGSLPIGSIIPYSGETAPEGYSICDGKELNRETYKELFSIIGTTFGGGDGTSTFNLPDLKGKVSVGLDSSDTNFNTIGKTGGEKTHTLTINEMPSHNHKMYSPASVTVASGSSYGIPDLGISTTPTTNTGGGQAHNNLQPYIVLNYIIKIYGEAMLTGDVIDSLEGDSSYNAPSIHAVNTKIKELEAYSSTAIDEGSEITLDPNPNPNYNPINIQIDGKSEQTTTKGNQLLDFSKYDAKSDDTMTLTFENDVLTTTCTASGTYRAFVWNIIDLIKANQGKTLYFTFDKYDESQATSAAVNLQVKIGDTTSYINLVSSDGVSIPYAIPEDVSSILTVNFRILPNNSTTAKASTLVITKPMLQFGTEKLDYEEYTGGQPSPSPDYPQEIKSVSGVENLLPNNIISQELNGVTFTVNNDKTITATGTATGTTDIYFVGSSSEYIDMNLEDGIYNLNGCQNGSAATYMLYCVQNRAGTLSYHQSFQKTGTDIKVQSGDTFRFFIRVLSGTTLDNIIFKPMLSRKMADYVPYGHWLRVENTGKNLFSSKLEVGGIDTTTGLNVTNNTRKRTKDFILIQPNTTYTFSYKNQGNYAKWGWYILYDNNQQIVSSYTFENDYDVTFTSPNDTYYFKMYFGNAENVDVNSFDCQLEKGTEATSYEPYQEQSMLIDMNKPNLFDKDNVILDKGINTNTGALYSSDTQFSTDYINIENIPSISTNGVSNTSNQIYGALYDENKTYLASIFSSTSNLKINNLSAVYVRLTFLNEYLDSLEIYEGFKPYYELCSDDTTKDELGIDKEGNVYVTQNIGEDVLNGSESWVMPSSTTLPNMFQISTNINLSKYGSDGSNAKALSNYFINGNTQNVRTTDGFVLFTQSNVNYIRIVNTNISTVADFKTWLSTHPVTVKYILAEPQTISLGKMTPLKLLEGTNNITTNDELQPNMKIEYYTDIMGNPGVIPDYDGLPVGSEIDFDGTEIPDGFVQVDDPNTYSSEEVVIGIWFGKKLYRKSFRFNELATGTNNIVHGIDNLNEITNAYGSCKRNDDKIQPVPRVDASELGWQIGITDVDTQSFQLYVGTRYNGASKIKNGNVTLEYTKTTD